MLRPGSPWRTGITRVLALGPSRIALGLAIVLVLVSLALPFWSLSEAMGTDQNISSFSWTTFTTDRYVGGVWDGTVILPYTSTALPYRAVASALGTAYLLDLVFLVVLAVVLALFSMEYGRAMPTLSLLVLGTGARMVDSPPRRNPGDRRCRPPVREECPRDDSVPAAGMASLVLRQIHRGGI